MFGSGNGSCCWIIIIVLLLVFCCGNDNGCGNSGRYDNRYDRGCGF